MRLFSIGLATVVTIVFWPEKRFSKATEAPAATSSKRSADQVTSQSGTSPEPPLRSAHETYESSSLDNTLSLIRSKLVRLGQTPKADKGAEDELMTELLAMLNNANAAEITRALSTEELHSRFGVAALQQWLKADLFPAASWVAARADATDEHAWAVAHELIHDQIALDYYCARLPDNAWRQSFLKSAAQEAMWENPAGAIRLTGKMNSAGTQLDLLQTTVCAWMISNPTAASGWITRMPESLLKEELFCAGVKTLAGTDPVRAIEWLASSAPTFSPGSQLLLDETFQDVSTTWVENAPIETIHFSVVSSP